MIDCLPDVAALPAPVEVLCIFTGKPIAVLNEAAEADVKAKFVDGLRQRLLRIADT